MSAEALRPAAAGAPQSRPILPAGRQVRPGSERAPAPSARVRVERGAPDVNTDVVANPDRSIDLAPVVRQLPGLEVPASRGVPSRVPPWQEPAAPADSGTNAPAPARTDPLPGRGSGPNAPASDPALPPTGRTPPPADRTVPPADRTTPPADRPTPGSPSDRGIPADRPGDRGLPSDRTVPPARTGPAGRTPPADRVDRTAPVEAPREIDRVGPVAEADEGLSTWDKIDNGISWFARIIHGITMNVVEGAGWLFSAAVWLVASPALLFGVESSELWEGIRNVTRPVFAGLGGFFSGIFQLPTAAARVVLYFAQDLASLRWTQSWRGLGETLLGPVSGVVGMVLQPFTFAFREFVNERSEVGNERRRRALTPPDAAASGTEVPAANRRVSSAMD